MPHTGYATQPDNPVEKLFWGRLKLTAGASELYFSKENITQTIVHELKYQNNKQLGVYIGRMMGKNILASNRFGSIDALIPLPLYASRERRREYNQAEIISKGMAAVMGIPIITGNVIRNTATESQTRKRRKERWQNVEGTFSVRDGSELNGKHLLLVDDVVTTGATLEACGSEILKVAGTTLSIATLAYVTH